MCSWFLKDNYYYLFCLCHSPVHVEARVWWWLAWEQPHRSGQQALLSTLTDKPTTVQLRHTLHVLWHYVSSSFNKIRLTKLSPPFVPSCWVEVCPQWPTTCSVYRSYNSPGWWCAGVEVRVCVISRLCRYETPHWVIAWPCCISAVSLSDPWTHVTSHPHPQSLDRRFNFLMR